MGGTYTESKIPTHRQPRRGAHGLRVAPHLRLVRRSALAHLAVGLEIHDDPALLLAQREIQHALDQRAVRGAKRDRRLAPVHRGARQAKEGMLERGAHAALGPRDLLGRGAEDAPVRLGHLVHVLASCKVHGGEDGVDEHAERLAVRAPGPIEHGLLRGHLDGRVRRELVAAACSRCPRGGAARPRASPSARAAPSSRRAPSRWSGRASGPRPRRGSSAAGAPRRRWPRGRARTDPTRRRRAPRPRRRAARGAPTRTRRARSCPDRERCRRRRPGIRAPASRFAGRPTGTRRDRAPRPSRRPSARRRPPARRADRARASRRRRRGAPLPLRRGGARARAARAARPARSPASGAAHRCLSGST